MFQELNKKEKTNKGRITMRRSIYLFALLTLFVIGCSEESSVFAPNNNVNTNEPNWIALPQAEGLGVNATYTVSKVIDGSKGGMITYGDLMQAQSGNTKQVYAACYFPAGAFSGTKTITMTLDTKKCIGTFSPAMTFNKPVSFSALYSGVNLSNYNVSELAFVYFGTNNVMTIITSSYLYINKDKGVLGILNAQLPHFSRYGFIRSAI